jgi:hypothetical protein
LSSSSVLCVQSDGLELLADRQPVASLRADAFPGPGPVALLQRHLTNVKIAKQDPYCSLVVGTERNRTSVIKKGGQHPEWDEQVKFDIVEDASDLLARPKPDGLSASDSSGSLGRPGAAAGKKKVFAKGTKTLKLAVYADAPREPELVGEAVFDLAKALNTGEDEGA